MTTQIQKCRLLSAAVAIKKVKAIFNILARKERKKTHTDDVIEIIFKKHNTSETLSKI